MKYSTEKISTQDESSEDFFTVKIVFFTEMLENKREPHGSYGMAKNKFKGFLALAVIYLAVCFFYANCARNEEARVPASLGTADIIR